MTKSVGVHEAKTHLSKLLDDVAAGEEVGVLLPTWCRSGWEPHAGSGSIEDGSSCLRTSTLPRMPRSSTLSSREVELLLDTHVFL